MPGPMGPGKHGKEKHRKKIDTHKAVIGSRPRDEWDFISFNGLVDNILAQRLPKQRKCSPHLWRYWETP